MKTCGGWLILCHKAGAIRVGQEQLVVITKQGYCKECQGQCSKDKR